MEYYPIYLNISNKKCLVVGAGNVAIRKIDILLKAGAKVVVIAPDYDSKIMDYSEKGLITLHTREFVDQDIEGCSIVIGATNYTEVNNRIFEIASKRNIPVNIVDCPELCTFIVPSIVDRGKLLISISTQGASPAFARTLRMKLEKQFGKEYNLLLRIMDEIRKITSNSVPDQKRRQSLYEDIIDGELLELCRSCDSDKISDYLSVIFSRNNLSCDKSLLTNIINQSIKMNEIL